MRTTTHSEVQTEVFAQQFAKRLKCGDIVALLGGIGAGKTAFTRGLCVGLGYGGRVTSPTFNLLHEYCGDVCVRHYDLYRINGAEDLEELGFWDGIDDCITVIEWSERVLDVLSSDCWRVEIMRIGDEERQIEIIGHEENYTL
ncbi:MAG: tRNA (adenosine(37)-N6)-threonylcarbamoyltransferase complex ATPase subunit type 1 TsaE [Oscillospiraceae bacterium]|nr:tRNA (adenosine(37)-N6)-threonylcarbamoyltransferase complex ATPase subunit type 1 TsaE [Oscillospiraceae bacterium]